VVSAFLGLGEEIMNRAVLVALTVVLLCGGQIGAARSAVASSSIAVFTQRTGDGITVAEHREGDAVLLHSRYRVQIGNVEDGPLTVKAILSGARRRRSFREMCLVDRTSTYLMGAVGMMRLDRKAL
jgi:hypothetical protein